MSCQLSELCTLLVEEVAGSLASTIFSVLVTHGSLSLPQIVQCSKVNPRYVKNALTLLLQRRLVTHDSTTLRTNRTYYEANISNAYRLLRAGKYAILTDTRLGKEAASVVQTIQERGFIAASELSEKENSESNSHVHLQGNHHAFLDALFRSHHIVRGRDEDLVTPGALRTEVENELRAQFPKGVTGIKKKRELEGLTTRRLKRRRDDNEAALHLIPLSSDAPRFTHNTNAETSQHKQGYADAKVNGNVEHSAEFGINGHASQAVEPDHEDGTSDSQRHNNKAGTNSVNPGSKKGKKRVDIELNGNDAAPTPQTSQRPKRRKLNKGGSSTTGTNGDLQDKEHDVANGEAFDTTRNEASNADVESNIDFAQPNNVSADGHVWKEQPYFRISPEKFDVSMRTQLLVEFCLRCLGEPTAKVYEALLKCMEANTRRCYDDLGDIVGDFDDDDEAEDDEEAALPTQKALPGVSAAAITSLLDPKVELYADDAQAKSKSNRSATASTINPSGSDFPIKMNPRIPEVEHHLRILAEHENDFVEVVPGNNSERWWVDFSRVTSKMMQQELHNIIQTRFDGPSARIARILQSKGKMEEKYLANISLIKQKDIRAKLALLQEAGFLDVQEVPRDTSRQPSRTIYLWFFDEERCRSVVLNDTYQMISRLLQRMRFEREKARTVLDKASRTDVSGREDELLNEREKAALRELERKEEKIWVQVSRLDDTVALLRDLS